MCGARIWVVKHLANDWLAGEIRKEGEGGRGGGGLEREKGSKL